MKITLKGLLKITSGMILAAALLIGCITYAGTLPVMAQNYEGLPDISVFRHPSETMQIIENSVASEPEQKDLDFGFKENQPDEDPFDNPESTDSGLTDTELTDSESIDIENEYPDFNIEYVADDNVLTSEDFTYSISDDQVTITGYTGSGGAVVIPDEIEGLPVTTIKASAFRNCTMLTSITFPASLTSIEDGTSSTGSFVGCSSLESIIFDNSPVSVGDYAFYNCQSLTSIEFGSEIKTINAFSYSNCRALESIILPTSIENVGRYAFSNCIELVSAIFENCSADIGEDAFYYCSKLEVIELGNNILTIGRYAFYECRSLLNIKFPETMTSIEEYVFSCCYSLKTVNIGSSITSIDPNAFYRCNDLENFVVDVANPNYASLDGVLFNQAKTTLIKYPAGYPLTSYLIPDGVTEVESEAFHNCASIANIAFPSSLINIGDCAFYSCENLENVEFGRGVETIGEFAFEYCKSLVSIKLPASLLVLMEGAFEDCYNLKSVAFENSAADIGDWAFSYCYELADIDLGNSIKSIGYRAFYRTGLETVLIPASVATVAQYAFANCEMLRTIYLKSVSTLLGSFLFDNCPKFDGIVYLVADDDFYYDENGVVFNAAKTMLLKYPADLLLASYTVPSGVRIPARSGHRFR